MLGATLAETLRTQRPRRPLSRWEREVLSKIKFMVLGAVLGTLIAWLAF